jgi:CSLREA domain-containing protein
VRYPIALLAAAFALLLLAGPAAAVTVHVDVTNDEDDGSCVHPDCSLREAVKYAPVGATIDVPAGTYSLATELEVPRTMTIDGASSASTTITAGGTHRTIHDTAGPVTFRDLKITGGNGNGSGFGGGIMDSSTELLTLDRVRVTDNDADLSFAGGILNDGGGGVAANGPTTVRRSVIDGNGTFLQGDSDVTSSGGGGIFVADGNLTVIDSEIRDNHVNVNAAKVSDEDVANNGGGGIYLAKYLGSGSLTLTRSTVADNTATVSGQTKVNDNGGGGIYLKELPLNAVNSTVSSNAVAVPGIMIDNGGGGIFAADANASLLNVTVSDNVAKGAMMDAGGALYRDGGSVTVRNTILARNQADSAANCFGSVASNGRNIEDKNTCGLSGAGDRKSTPIKLGPLKFNGGPTRTRAIFAGGPAFNTATACPATDQRGVARPTGTGCDRGAFEIALPVVQTGAVKKVRTGSARLLGSVIPNGKPTTDFFQFGKTKAYGSKTAVESAGAGVVAQPANGDAKGLKPATIYHYRLVAKNALGTSRGRDRTFITHMKLPAKCVKDRELTVPLQRPKGRKVVQATAFVDGKAFFSAGGSDVKSLKLKDLPAGPFKLRVVAKLASGRKVLGSRRYKPCA